MQKMKTYINTLLLFFSLTILSQNNQRNKNHYQTAQYVLKTSFNSIPADFRYLGKEISDDWKRTGYYAAGILGLVAADKFTTKVWQNHIEPNIDYNLPDITPNFLKGSANSWLKNNNAYLTYPLIGLYFGSVISKKEKGQFASINTFKAIAYSTLISHITLKTIFGRARPHEPLNSGLAPIGFDNSDFTSNNWDFGNSRGGVYILSSQKGSAFPSLHVTAYFAIAKVIQMEYDNYWVPYGLMGIAFASNIGGHNHWFSDMILGSIVGTLIGRSIVKSSWKARGILNKKKDKKITLNYTPRISPEFTGLRITSTF
jgi:hypothetical protein